MFSLAVCGRASRMDYWSPWFASGTAAPSRAPSRVRVGPVRSAAELVMLSILDAAVRVVPHSRRVLLGGSYYG